MAMTAMADAFERAGLSLAHIRFATANYDLARLVLNREPDPQRAVMRWLGMARMPEFMKEIVAYLAAVKEEMQPSGAGEDQAPTVGDGHVADRKQAVLPVPDPSSAADEDHSWRVQQDHRPIVSSAADPTSSGDEDHLRVAPSGYSSSVPAPDPKVAEGEDHVSGVQQDQGLAVPPSVAPAQERAQRKLTRLQSSFYLLTDRTGTHVPVEEIAVRKIPSHMNWLAGRAVQHGTDFMVLRNLYQHAPQVSDDFVKVGECMGKNEIRQWVRKGKEEAFFAAQHADATMAAIAGKQLGHD